LDFLLYFLAPRLIRAYSPSAQEPFFLKGRKFK